MSSLRIGNTIKSMVNNKKFHDVIFVVGDEKKEMFAFKHLLAAVSEPFDKMFYGNFEQELPIAIPDLTHRGFLNMLRYIHGYEINELEFDGLYEMCVAADKYLIEPLLDDLNEYYAKLNEWNDDCVSLFDQMVKSNGKLKSEALQKLIAKNSLTTFKSECFDRIDKTTLVEILKLDRLYVPEIVVLKAISRWIDAELKRQPLPANVSMTRSRKKQKIDFTQVNKETAFQQFKPHVRFVDLSAHSVATDVDLLGDLLSQEGAYSLLRHLTLNSIAKSEFTYTGGRNEDGSKFEIEFQFKIADAIRLIDCDARECSPKFYCRGIVWELHVNSKLVGSKRKIGLFLNCMGPENSHASIMEGWSITAHFEFKILSQSVNVHNKIRLCNYSFKQMEGRGVSDFIKRSYFEPTSGYVKNGGITIAVDLKANELKWK